MQRSCSQTETPWAREEFLGVSHAEVQGKTVQLGYWTFSEKDDEHRYVFKAEYPQLFPEESTDATEMNVMFGAFIVGELQRFRAGAIGASKYKQENIANRSEEMAWDRLSISHAMGAFTSDVLSVEFQLLEYGAGAAHSHHTTRTLNYLLKPARQLEFWDIFPYQNRKSCVEAISRYCIFSINEQKAEYFKDEASGRIESIPRLPGSNEEDNFKKLLLERGGVRFFFDPYLVGCYAEGRYDVFVPTKVLSSFMHGSVLAVL